MDKKIKVEDKINKDLTVIVQAKWDQIMNETGSKIEISPEHFQTLKDLFHLAYQEGQADMFSSIKEVYENDIDHFEFMFEEDENYVAAFKREDVNEIAS